ncbi:MAG TPA: arginine--tRNA ligase [Candidatus Levybacteria bacterium]|nr:arginine--tRNA ligase [Candidatus Levybacteria bacterium]
MDIKSQLQTQLKQIIQELFDTEVSFSVDVPENAEHGDYSTNAALILAKPQGKSPREIAGQIQQRLENSKQELGIEKIDIAGAGFVNIFISQEKLFQVLTEIEEKKDTFGKNELLSGKKIITEFTDPNPFKEFHIGHLYSNTVGEAISRLYAAQGAEVKRVCYQGDIGLHVAKALYGILNNEVKIEDVEDKSIEEKAKYLGQSYAKGATAYEENEEAKAEIIEINKKVFAKDASIMEIYEKGKTWSLEYFNNIYARLGMQFDQFFFESEVGEDGKKLVLGYLEKGVFEESEGAVIFPGEKYGLHNRVFINALDLPTYEAKELGLAPAKYDYFPYDESVIITGNEINEYFKVLLKALSLIRPELAEKTVHIGHGMVRLPQGKMSSRTGNVLTGEWLLDEAKKRAYNKIQEVTRSEKRENREARVSIADQLEVSEKVGIGAIKYALLKNGIGGDIAFSFDESISFEGNAGPYLQYTYVRTQSLMEKAKNQGMTPEIVTPTTYTSEETVLLKHLIHFSEAVAYAAASYSPNHLAEYLFALAQKFNAFYANQQIISVSITDGDNVSVTPSKLQLDSTIPKFRLALTQSVGQTLKNGLTLLGIPTVEKM